MSMKRECKDLVCVIKSRFDAFRGKLEGKKKLHFTISVVNIQVNVQYSREVWHDREDPEDDIVDVAETRSRVSYRMSELISGVGCVLSSVMSIPLKICKTETA